MQRVGNTEFESYLSDQRDLDKTPISPEATDLESHKDHRRFEIDTGQMMRVVTGLLAVIFLLGHVAASYAVVRIGEDRGGRIGTYLDKYEAVRNSGQSVVIDGLCASACTIVLGTVPHDKICVTSHAALGFHAAWDLGSNGRAVTNSEATLMLYSMYPSAIQRWIKERGGLTRRMIFLRGRQLADMYRPCYLDAQASSAR